MMERQSVISCHLASKCLDSGNDAQIQLEYAGEGNFTYLWPLALCQLHSTLDPSQGLVPVLWDIQKGE
jgi:hypothetical protein